MWPVVPEMAESVPEAKDEGVQGVREPKPCLVRWLIYLQRPKARRLSLEIFKVLESVAQVDKLLKAGEKAVFFFGC